MVHVQFLIISLPTEMIVNVLSLLELQSIITTKKTCSKSLQLQLGKSGIGKLQEHLFNPIRMLDDKVIPRTMCLFFNSIMPLL